MTAPMKVWLYRKGFTQNPEPLTAWSETAEDKKMWAQHEWDALGPYISLDALAPLIEKAKAAYINLVGTREGERFADLLRALEA